MKMLRAIKMSTSVFVFPFYLRFWSPGRECKEIPRHKALSQEIFSPDKNKSGMNETEKKTKTSTIKSLINLAMFIKKFRDTKVKSYLLCWRK